MVYMFHIFKLQNKHKVPSYLPTWSRNSAGQHQNNQGFGQQLDGPPTFHPQGPFYVFSSLQGPPGRTFIFIAKTSHETWLENAAINCISKWMGSHGWLWHQLCEASFFSSWGKIENSDY